MMSLMILAKEKGPRLGSLFTVRGGARGGPSLNPLALQWASVGRPPVQASDREAPRMPARYRTPKWKWRQEKRPFAVFLVSEAPGATCHIHSQRQPNFHASSRPFGLIWAYRRRGAAGRVGGQVGGRGGIAPGRNAF